MSCYSVQKLRICLLVLPCLMCLSLLACVITDSLIEQKPVTRQRIYSFPKGILAKVAVMPFYPRLTALREQRQQSVVPSDAADLVSRFVTEALIARGVDVVAPSDFEAAFLAEGVVAPRLDSKAAGQLAAKDFGASAVLLGELTRYRERSGGTHPASVAFEMTLYTAPGGERVWVSLFDETQQALSENLMNARRYPQGGARWLSAAELARWGAEAAIEALPERR